MELLSDYDFNLPKNLIATEPPVSRGESRLLALTADNSQPQHDYFKNISAYLRSGDLLIVNNTKVMKARLEAYKKTGGKVEILLVRPLEDGQWAVLLSGRGPFLPGCELSLGGGVFLISGRNPDGLYIGSYGSTLASSKLESSKLEGSNLGDFARDFGELPLPPYFGRKADSRDELMYQTIFASDQTLGAVAAPTAGLHFTEQILADLKSRDISCAELTLHVGPGTFLPVRTENIAEHKMHSEFFSLDYATAQTLNQARDEGRRIIAVGTTSMRVLEQIMQWAQTSSEREPGRFFACDNSTDIFIRPGYKFLACDALITNFHVPKSTLLMLVCAAAGKDRIFSAYQEAVNNKYKFFSYGDACYIEILHK